MKKLGGNQMVRKFKCPMMCGMNMMHQPEPMCIKPGMLIDEEAETDNYFEDEEDDRQFIKMYPESCKKMMFYIKIEIDKVEEKHAEIHDRRPDREMIKMMVENAYGRMIKEMPEIAGDEENRQYPAGRLSRDLLRLLLLNELFRRRRRYRRRHYYSYSPGEYSAYDYYYYD